MQKKKPLVLSKSSPLKALTEQELSMVSGGKVPKQPDNPRWQPMTIDDGS